MKKNVESDIIFLSGIFPKESYSELTNSEINANIQNAANIWQWHIINGMEQVLKKPVTLLNVPFVGSYPKQYKKVYLKTFEFSHCENALDVNIGFINLPFIRHLLIAYHRDKYLNTLLNDKEKKYVVAYALTLRNVGQLAYIKKRFPEIRTCMIVPDLPMYMRLDGNKIYRLLKNIENELIKKCLKYVDGYVLLTKQMNEFVKTKKYCVIEGISTENGEFSYTNQKTKIIMYTGTLDEKYGISELLQAFAMTKNQEYRLYIAGNGNCKEKVISMSEIDPRIVYLGQIEHERVIEYQKQASVLINPRQNNSDFTKYSFPSKNLEYLSLGVPVIAYKLDGIPDEYDDYILYVEENSIEALKNKMEEVLEYSDEKRKEIGKRARNFVLEEKNEVVQAKKVINLLYQL